MVLFSIAGMSAQSFEHFMYQDGGEVIANLAHPTNTYESCSIQSSGKNSIIVKIEYDQYITEVKLYAIGDIFYKLEVLRDTDFYPPFRAIENMKNMLYSFLEDEFAETIAKIEKEIGTKIKDMNGKEMTCAIFTIEWMKYKYKNQ